MPAASSTRAVAVLMLGIMAGCTQPSSMSTLRGCSRVGQRWARAGAGAGTLSRKAFGKQLVWLGGNVEIISRARIEIESMRLMVLKAAKAMDVLGNREARIWLHMVKAMVPERVCQIIDQAIQMHGATGISQWTPLAGMYTGQRTLRIADGPDEVHHLVVGRNEIRQYEGGGEDQTSGVVWRN